MSCGDTAKGMAEERVVQVFDECSVVCWCPTVRMPFQCTYKMRIVGMGWSEVVSSPSSMTGADGASHTATGGPMSRNPAPPQTAPMAIDMPSGVSSRIAEAMTSRDVGRLSAGNMA